MKLQFDPESNPIDARLAQLAESNWIVRVNLQEYLAAADTHTSRELLFMRIINQMAAEMPTWPPGR